MRRAAVIVALAAAGCGNDATPLSPRARPDAGGGAVDAAAPADAGARVRSVEWRNPFGRTSLEHNFLVDGDFEWTSGNGQFGWRAVGNAGETGLGRETGGLCRSGVSCGVLVPGTDLLAMGAAPRDAAVEVALWAKPPSGQCALTSVSLISCTSFTISNLGAVPPVSDTPDAAGWCRHHAIVTKVSYQPCLFVSSFADPEARTLVDDASITAATGAGSSTIAATAPSADQKARIERALAVLHQRRRFGMPERSLAD